MELNLTKKQALFIKADADEVLFGGSGGGGKSYAQLIDALIYASKYKESKQLLLRRTYAELEKSLIRVSRALYPREIATYNDSKHVWTFKNGSVIDFGYCQNSGDVYQYQSAEYDVIRFDELTHFTEDMYVYLISRIRGTKNYPRSIKSSTNPGGVGHSWVKERFIDAHKWGEKFETEQGTTRIFIPARVQENKFLMANDPDYLKRLENLPENEKKALLYGEWDIFEGRYFSEFRRNIHVIEPFEIKPYWRIYRSIDYGLDCFACYFIAIDERGNAYVYKEIHESDLIVSKAAERMNEFTLSNEKIYITLMPPDLWNRHRESGKSTADIFMEYGVKPVKAPNDRVSGWMNVKEWLKVFKDEQGYDNAKLHIFSNCKHLIKSLEEVQIDDRNPSDVADKPHELTHAVDSLRYFCAYRTRNADVPASKPTINFEEEKPKPNPLGNKTRVTIV